MCISVKVSIVCNSPLWRGKRQCFNGGTVVDINECLGVGSAEPVCDRSGHNVLGSYKWECEIGYSLQPDKVSCKAVGGK